MPLRLSTASDTPRSVCTTGSPSQESLDRACVSMTGSAIAIYLGNPRAGADQRESEHMTARHVGHHLPSDAQTPQRWGDAPSKGLFSLVFRNGSGVASCVDRS